MPRRGAGAARQIGKRTLSGSAGRVGQPWDIAPIAVFLASNGSSWLTLETRKEIQMSGSSNVFVLGVTGQVGKLVAKNLQRRKANFSVVAVTLKKKKEIA